MKKRWKHSKNSVMRGVLTAACAVLFFASQKSICFAEATGKVKAPSAYVRQTADANSEPVGSTSAGKTVTIISQTTDTSGYVWYEVYVEAGKTGYIRSDLLDVDSSSGTIPTSSSAAPAQSGEQAPASSASGAEILPETGMDAQYATIKVRSANIRSGASKSKGKVCSLPENTQVIVSGQTEGSDGTWYYITFTEASGEEKDGYVRHDMVNLGEMVPVEEPVEEPQETQPESETPEETPAANQDYELKYEYDETAGESVWKIYDYTKSTEYAEVQNVKVVLEAAHAQSLNNALDAETVSKQRIVIIVLIAVVIILAVVMTIMIFKLRDAYYESYEDDEDEEEEEEEEEEDRRRKEKRRDAESDTRKSDARRSDGRKNEERSERSRGSREREEREEPVRRKSTAREERQSAPRRRTEESDKRMPSREVSYKEETEAPVKAAPKKKAKNFMIDDDDFEFEFLNTKNKDKDL